MSQNNATGGSLGKRGPDSDDSVVIQPAEKKNKEEEGKVDFPLRCDACNLVFSSELTASQHFNGKRHAKKVSVTLGTQEKQLADKSPDEGTVEVLNKDVDDGSDKNEQNNDRPKPLMEVDLSSDRCNNKPPNESNINFHADHESKPQDSIPIPQHPPIGSIRPVEPPSGVELQNNTSSNNAYPPRDADINQSSNIHHNDPRNDRSYNMYPNEPRNDQPYNMHHNDPRNDQSYNMHHNETRNGPSDHRGHNEQRNDQSYNMYHNDPRYDQASNYNEPRKDLSYNRQHNDPRHDQSYMHHNELRNDQSYSINDNESRNDQSYSMQKNDPRSDQPYNMHRNEPRNDQSYIDHNKSWDDQSHMQHNDPRNVRVDPYSDNATAGNYGARQDYTSDQHTYPEAHPSSNVGSQKGRESLALKSFYGNSLTSYFNPPEKDLCGVTPDYLEPNRRNDDLYDQQHTDMHHGPSYNRKSSQDQRYNNPPEPAGYFDSSNTDHSREPTGFFDSSTADYRTDPGRFYDSSNAGHRAESTGFFDSPSLGPPKKKESIALKSFYGDSLESFFNPPEYDYVGNKEDDIAPNQRSDDFDNEGNNFYSRSTQYHREPAEPEEPEGFHIQSAEDFLLDPPDNLMDLMKEQSNNHTDADEGFYDKPEDFNGPPEQEQVEEDPSSYLEEGIQEMKGNEVLGDHNSQVYPEDYYESPQTEKEDQLNESTGNYYSHDYDKNNYSSNDDQSNARGDSKSSKGQNHENSTYSNYSNTYNSICDEIMQLRKKLNQC